MIATDVTATATWRPTRSTHLSRVIERVERPRQRCGDKGLVDLSTKDAVYDSSPPIDGVGAAPPHSVLCGEAGRRRRRLSSMFRLDLRIGGGAIARVCGFRRAAPSLGNLENAEARDLSAQPDLSQSMPADAVWVDFLSNADVELEQGASFVR